MKTIAIVLALMSPVEPNQSPRLLPVQEEPDAVQCRARCYWNCRERAEDQQTECYDTCVRRCPRYNKWDY